MLILSAEYGWAVIYKLRIRILKVLCVMYSAIIEIYRKQIIHMEKKNRLVYLDIARGIAMISIVLGHLRLNNIIAKKIIELGYL